MFTRSGTGSPDQTTIEWIFQKQLDLHRFVILPTFFLVTEKPEVIQRILGLRMAKEGKKYGIPVVF